MMKTDLTETRGGNYMGVAFDGGVTLSEALGLGFYCNENGVTIPTMCPLLKYLREDERKRRAWPE